MGILRCSYEHLGVEKIAEADRLVGPHLTRDEMLKGAGLDNGRFADGLGNRTKMS